MTVSILSAYVTNNSVSTSNLLQLITTTYESVVGMTKPAPEPEPEKPVPAVSIKRSIRPDYLISLEDGQPYKSLKRHLGTRNLTPEQYRAKWGLPSDYPMVAPNYAKQRSELAKQMGLGRTRVEPAPTASKQGRPKKV